MWLTIIMTLLSFFLQKRDTPEQRRKAALVAAGVGAATYYVSHETEWGRENLGQYDGVDFTSGQTGTSGGASVPNAAGSSGNSSSIGSDLVKTTGNVLSSWGGTGTAAVIGTSAIATNSSLQKWLPYLLIGGAFLVLSRK